MTRKEAEHVLRLLASRNGFGTIIELDDGDICRAIHVSWGKDLGDEFENVYVNMALPASGQKEYFFQVTQIAEVRDEQGKQLFKPSASSRSN